MNYNNKFALSLIIISSFIYISIIFLYTASMPVMDDYDAILRFLNEYKDLTTLTGKLNLLLAQHGEHRIVFDRLFGLVDTTIFKEVNFLHYTIFGNIAWFATIYILWIYAKKRANITLYEFTPIILIMLTFAHAGLITWAMTSVQQYWQLFFAVASIYFMPEKRLAISIFFMFFAIITGGGGIALIPIISLYYLINRDWKSLLIFLASSIFILYFYFIYLDYIQPSRRASISYMLFEIPKNVALSFLMFLGNFAKLATLAQIVGAILTLLFIYKLKSLYKNYKFLMFSGLYILLISILVALSRSNISIYQALSTRYAIYSLLFASIIYLAYLLTNRNKKVIVNIAYIVSIPLFIFYIYYAVPKFQERKYMAENSMLYPSPGHAEAILKNSYKNKIFTNFDKNKLPSNLKNLTKQSSGINKFCILINKKQKVCSKDLNDTNILKPLEIKLKNLPFLLQGWVIDSKNQKEACAVRVKVDDYTHLFWLNSNYNYRNLPKNKKFRYSQLDAKFNISYLKDGNHTIKIETIASDCKSYYNTLTIPLNIKPISNKEYNNASSVNTQGYIDKIDINKKGVTIVGWYVVKGIDSSKLSIVIDIDNKKYFARSNITREAVANYLKDKKYTKSGFYISVPLKELSKGEHTFKVYLIDKSSYKMYKSNKDYMFNIR